MSKVKVRLIVKGYKSKVNEEVSVDSERAEQLVANRQAVYVSPAKQAEADKQDG